MGINSCLKIREKFGVKSQMRGGGERKERKDMLKAGQSRGSIVCNYKAMWFLIKRFP